MVAKSGKPRPSKVEAMLPLDFKSIELYIEAFPCLKSRILTILIFLLQSSNKRGRSRDAVKQINELYPKTLPTQPSFYGVGAFLWRFWESVVMVAQKIPYNNRPKQDILIGFLMFLHRSNMGIFDGEVCVSYYFLLSYRIVPTYVLSTFQVLFKFMVRLIKFCFSMYGKTSLCYTTLSETNGVVCFSFSYN